MKPPCTCRGKLASAQLGEVERDSGNGPVLLQIICGLAIVLIAASYHIAIGRL